MVSINCIGGGYDMHVFRVCLTHRGWVCGVPGKMRRINWLMMHRRVARLAVIVAKIGCEYERIVGHFHRGIGNKSPSISEEEPIGPLNAMVSVTPETLSVTVRTWVLKTKLSVGLSAKLMFDRSM
jgi:hypothetical protein